MSELTIYDTSGNEISPHGDGVKQNQRIGDFATTSVELAVEPQGQKIIGCFDVKESATQRSEQYWGEYIFDDTSTPILEFKNAVNNQIGEWGYILDTENTRSRLFGYLDHASPDPPGEALDRRTLESLAERDQSVKIGVQRPKDAIGLFLEYFQEYSVGIVGSNKTGDPSELDIIITLGSDRSGINPLGGTRQQWDSEKRQIKSNWKSQIISSISSDFNKLKKEYDMTTEDIRRDVPELSTTDQIRRQFSRSNSSSLVDELKQSPRQTLVLSIAILLIILAFPHLLSLLGGVEGYLDFPGDIISQIQSLLKTII